ncbi:protein of unassigned function [Methylobacterium oryzae CBMB20]|uniref:Protein of unassigned function n=1 Tax=Methylobacterium oryzae CBMB20 TaxID=693986 RepID=A0A089NU27_9HYPH|nr:protein of unassigned function [Methylobacterium oryzae CBMB20]
MRPSRCVNGGYVIGPDRASTFPGTTVRPPLDPVNRLQNSSRAAKSDPTAPPKYGIGATGAPCSTGPEPAR